MRNDMWLLGLRNLLCHVHGICEINYAVSRKDKLLSLRLEIAQGISDGFPLRNVNRAVANISRFLPLKPQPSHVKRFRIFG